MILVPVEPRGCGTAEKISGRNRHVLVGRRGNLSAVRVTDGTIQDHGGGIDLMRQVRALFPWLVAAIAGSACAGRI